MSGVRSLRLQLALVPSVMHEERLKRKKRKKTNKSEACAEVRTLHEATH